MSDAAPALEVLDPGHLAGLAPLLTADLARYLEGGAPGLEHALDPRVPRLPATVALLAGLSGEPDERAGVALELLVTPAGDGRSTGALQIAAELARAGRAVRLRRGGAPLDVARALAELRELDDPALVVDDAHEIVDELFALLAAARRELGSDRPLAVLACAERGAWARWGGDLRPWSHHAARVRRTDGLAGVPDAADAAPGERDALDDAARTADVASLLAGAWRATGLREVDAAAVEEALRAPVGAPCTFAAVRGALVGDEDAWRDRARVWTSEAGAEPLRALVVLGVAGLLEIGALDEALLARALGVDAPRPMLEALAAHAPLTRGDDGWSFRAPECAAAVVDALVDDGAGVLRPHLEALLDAAIDLEAEDPDGAAPAVRRAARLAARLARPPGDVRWILADTGAEGLAVELAARAHVRAPRVDRLVDRITALRRAGRADESCDVAAVAWPDLVGVPGHAEHARRLVGSWSLSELRRGGAEAAARAVATQLVALSDDVAAAGGPTELPRITLEVALRGLAWIGADEGLGVPGDLRERLAVLEPFRAAAPERLELDESAARIDVARPADVPLEADDFAAWLAALDEATCSARPAALGSGALAFSEATRQYRRYVASRIGPLVRALPEGGGDDALQDAFEAQLEAAGIQPYEAQMEAYFSVFDCTSVLLNTPTGSGKSLVAMAAHFAALGRGERSVYTAPTKALVNEKFFDLCRRFGSANVGLLTGDASVNRDAPILCCTAEILSSIAQVEGSSAPFRWVVMDEFHYFSDKERGIAWLMPLVLLEGTRFLLMSATIGEVLEAQKLVETLTGQRFELVRSTERPVPLVFSYRVESERDAINAMRDEEVLPGYVVCVTRAEASDKALAEPSSGGWSSKTAEVPEHVFTSPYGRQLKRALKAGVGLHHSGLLPKYRRLVETMSGAGQLNLIFGTDTLGVGVNLPIRTVLFPRLVRNAGKRELVRLDAARFQQLGGRAGRAGLVGGDGDPQGDVWVLAPEDEIERRKAAARAANQAAKSKKPKKKSPPKKAGGKGPSWSEQTMQKLVDSPARPLEVRFELSAGLVMNFVRRGAEGVGRLRRLIADLPLKAPEREHLEAQLTELLGTLEARREVRAAADGASFAVGQRAARRAADGADGAVAFDRPLLRFLHDVVWDFVPADGDEGAALDVLSLVESVVDDPRVVLGRQAKKIRDEHWQAHRESDVDAFDMTAKRDFADKRDEIEHPQPLREEIDEAFDRWDEEHPGLTHQMPSPKSVVRDMFELGMGFQEYVRHYRLQIFEGELLRYLSEVWRVLSRGLPPSRALDRGTAELRDWLGALVRHVDSSLLDEWERLDDPSRAVAEGPEPVPLPFDVTTHPRAFTRMVRNATFRWVRALVARAYEDLAPGATADAEDALTAEQLAAAHAEYLAECHSVDVGPDARGPELFAFDADTGRVEQTLLDPEGYREWALIGAVDFDASRAEGDAVIALECLERKGLDFGTR